MWKKYVSTQCPPKTRKAEMGAQNNKSGRTSMQAGAAKHMALKNGNASSGKKATTQVTNQECTDYSVDNALIHKVHTRKSEESKERTEASQSDQGSNKMQRQCGCWCCKSFIGHSTWLCQCWCWCDVVYRPKRRVVPVWCQRGCWGCKPDNGNREW